MPAPQANGSLSLKKPSAPPYEKQGMSRFGRMRTLHTQTNAPQAVLAGVFNITLDSASWTNSPPRKGKKMKFQSRFQGAVYSTVSRARNQQASMTDVAYKLERSRLVIYSAAKALERQGLVTIFRGSNSQWAPLVIAIRRPTTPE